MSGKTRVLASCKFLVDYYNLPYVHQGLRRWPNHERAIEKLTEHCVGLVRESLLPSVRPVHATLRLYGGWFVDDNGTKSYDRDEISAVLRKCSPLTVAGIRLRYEFADTSAALRADPIHGTLRIKPGIPRKVTRTRQELCSLSQCKMTDLRCWHAGKCPKFDTCGTKTESTLEYKEQKLVDTLIVSDHIALAIESPNEWTIAVSVDDDMIPGLLVASQFSPRTALLRIGRKKPCTYDAIFHRNNLLFFDRPE